MLGIRKNSDSSARCWSRRPSMNAVRFARVIRDSESFAKQNLTLLTQNGKRWLRQRMTPDVSVPRLVFYDCPSPGTRRLGALGRPQEPKARIPPAPGRFMVSRFTPHRRLLV